MTVLSTSVDPSTDEYVANRAALLERLAALDAEHATAVAGGGAKYVARHHQRGKLLVRERIELLVDPGSHFLELSPLAAWGSDFTVGASVVTGIGVVNGVECMINGSDPTVRGGASNPWTLKKTLRANQIALENRLPVIGLVESGGADLPTQKPTCSSRPGKIFHDLTRAVGHAGVTDDRARLRQLDRGRGLRARHVRLRRCIVRPAGQGVPRPVRRWSRWPPARTPTTSRSAGPTCTRGCRVVADHFAQSTSSDAIRHRARRSSSELQLAPSSVPAPTPAPPTRRCYDPEDQLLGIVVGRLPGALRPARGARPRRRRHRDFGEYKPLLRHVSIVTGWASIHGFPVGVLANARGVLFSEEAKKASAVHPAGQPEPTTPLVFLQNTTGFMVGAEYERGGIIKHGALLINAVSNSRVPHLTVTMGASYGAGNYGMCGRAYGPRFLFTWPNAKSAVMGPAQLAGVMTIVARQAAQARGQEFDEDGAAQLRAFVENQIEEQSLAPFLSGMLYDDGVIDPRDTRTVLGIALSAIHNGPVAGTEGYGVFRL